MKPVRSPNFVVETLRGTVTLGKIQSLVSKNLVSYKQIRQLETIDTILKSAAEEFFARNYLTDKDNGQ